VFHAPGRPPGDWGNPAWVQRHYEEQEEAIFAEIVNYLKTYKSKGEGISKFELARILRHRPDKIEDVARKYNGRWIDGVLNYVHTPRGYYVVWSRVGEDPILCLHEVPEEVYEVVVKEGQSLAVCDRCGARYVLPGGKVEVNWSLNDTSAPNTVNEMWGEPFTVSGRVLDFVSRGAVPNAKVRIMLGQPPYLFWGCIGEGLTDDFGYFSVDLTETFRGLQPGAYALSVDAFFNDVRFIKVNDSWIYLNLAERPAAPTWTRLSSSATVEVHVRSPEGAPVEGCQVALGPIKGLTGGGGSVRFTNVPLGCYELRAEAPGYVSKKFKVEVNNSSVHFNVMLERFDLLGGVVLPILKVVGAVALITSPIWGLYVIGRILKNAGWKAG
jgi:hypothetical protein